jgi:hypothetical protein
MRFFHTLVGAFHSPETYRNMRRSEGHGLAYSFVLVLFTTLLLTVYGLTLFHTKVFVSSHGSTPLFDDAVMQLAKQMPYMTFTNNKLVTAEPRSYTITFNFAFPKFHGKFDLATIDTTGATTYKNMKTPILVTANEFIVRDKKQIKIQPFKDVVGDHPTTLVINQAVAIDLGNKLIEGVHHILWELYLFIGAFIWLFFAGTFYILRLFMLLFMAVGGLAISRAYNDAVNFQTSMRMAAISFTPVACLEILFMAMGHMIAGFWLLLCGLVMLSAALYITRETPLAASS